MTTHMMKRTILAIGLAVLGSAVAQSANASLPSFIRETESSTAGTYSGTLVKTGPGQYSARWNNGALAIFKITHYDGYRIVLSRYDYAGASAGLTGVYDGVIVGNTVRGRTTWTHKGTTWNGTFSANW